MVTKMTIMPSILRKRDRAAEYAFYHNSPDVILSKHQLTNSYHNYPGFNYAKELRHLQC